MTRRSESTQSSAALVTGFTQCCVGGGGGGHISDNSAMLSGVGLTIICGFGDGRDSSARLGMLAT